jgi:hypothetical protein
METGTGQQTYITPKAKNVGFATEMEPGTNRQAQKHVEKDVKSNKMHSTESQIVPRQDMLDTCSSALSWGDVREPVKTRKAQTHRLDMSVWTPLTGVLSLYHG